MSYAPSFIELFRRAVTCVDKILEGAKPVDLPIEQREEIFWGDDRLEDAIEWYIAL